MDPDLSGAGSTLLGCRCKAPAVRFANMLFVSDDKTNSQCHRTVDQIWWKAQAVIFNSMALLLALVWSIQLVGVLVYSKKSSYGFKLKFAGQNCSCGGGV